MNKLRTISILVVIGCILFGAQLFRNKTKEQVIAYTNDQFIIPHNCKHLALIGCTPHPTNFLEQRGDNKELIKKLHIEDFLDLAYVTDSFVRTFKICKEQNIDHLLIAYLPIYFVRMRPLLGNQFVQYCRIYFNNIIPEITKLIKDAQKQTDYRGNTTLIVPADSQMARVPELVENKDDRTRYLIKQFPKLQNIKNSELTTITIINNESSQEDDMLIAYLKYEYLFDKPLEYRTASLDKERFHA